MSEQENHSPERIHSSIDLAGFYGRVLLEDQSKMNPDFEVTEISKAGKEIPDLKKRDYRPFETVSLHDREMEMQRKVANGEVEEEFQKQKESWEAAVDLQMHDDAYQPYRTKLESFFQKTQADKDLYAHYFSSGSQSEGSDKPVSGVKLFVQEMVELYTKTDGTVDLDKFQQDKDAIEWFAGIFGKPSKTIIVELMGAELRLKKDPQFVEKTLQEQVNGKSRLNELKPLEKQLLEHIREYGEIVLPFQTEAVRTRVRDIIKNNQRSLIMAGTGTGKTQETVKIVFNEADMFDKDNDIFVLSQPTKVNTSEVAKRIAEQLHLGLGKEVGYQHGDDKENRDKKAEHIAVLTEGVALHELLENGNLRQKLDDGKRVYFQFDEAHMKTAPGILLARQLMKLQALYPNLKVIVTSATIDQDLYKNYFQIADAASYTVEARQRHKLTQLWAADTERKDIFTEEGIRKLTDAEMSNDATEKVKNIVATYEDFGNIMIFVPGKRPIRSIRDTIENMQVAGDLKDKEGKPVQVEVLSITSVTTEEQKKELAQKIKDNPDKHYVIVCTDAAKTGITIERLKHVVLTTVGKQSVYDEAVGANTLVSAAQSQADTLQQAGRTGRTGDGFVHYLYINNNDFEQMAKFPIPETEQSDLGGLVLSLLNMDEDPYSVDLLTKLPKEHLDFAFTSLQRLGAVDASKKLTDVGKEMAKQPVDYHLGRALVEAKTTGCFEEMATMVAMKEQLAKEFFIDLKLDLGNAGSIQAARDLRFMDNRDGSDYLLLLNIWEQYPHGSSEMVQKKWCDDIGISYEGMKSVKKKRDKILQRNTDYTPRKTMAVEERNDILERSIAIGYQDRLLQRMNGTNNYALVHSPNEANASWQSPIIGLSRPDDFGIPTAVSSDRDEFIIGSDFNRTTRRDGTVVYYSKYNQRIKTGWIQ